jgi:hypothetical protein
MRGSLSLTAVALGTIFAAPSAMAADYILSQEISALGAVFLQSADSGKTNTDAEAQALYTLDSDIFLSDRLSVDAAFYLRWSAPNGLTGGPLMAEQDHQRSPYFDITELGIKWQDDSYGFKVGKFLQNYEFADYMSVLNRYNLSDYSNPLRPVKIGNWLAQGNVVFEQGTLALTVMPFHPTSGQPSSLSRWGGVSSNGVLLNSDDGGADNSSGMPDVTLIWQSSTDDFDYLLGLGAGHSTYGVVRLDPVALDSVNENPDQVNAFAGIAYPLERVRLYGEVYYQDTRNSRDDDFLRAVAGMSWDLYDFGERVFGFNDLKLTTEGLLDRTLNTQDAPLYIGASSSSRTLQNAIYVSVSADLNDDWSASQSVGWGTKKAELSSNSKITWSADDSTSVSGTLTLFDGTNDQSVFGEWRRNDLVSLEISHKF